MKKKIKKWKKRYESKLQQKKKKEKKRDIKGQTLKVETGFKKHSAFIKKACGWYKKMMNIYEISQYEN